MIFATVGTQLPFPRLISALDAIASRTGLQIVAQTADENASPRHIKHVPFLGPNAFERHSREASILVGHAGIGTVLTAKRLRKAVILYPRMASLKEHRNDHQLATARALQGVEGIYIADTDESLEAFIAQKALTPASPAAGRELAGLVDHLRRFIHAR